MTRERRDHIAVLMAGTAIVFAAILQVGVFWMAAGPGSAPVVEAMNTPAPPPAEAKAP